MVSRLAKSTIHIVACILLALNLRPALAAIGPLLDRIESSAGLTHTEASLLTALPVIVMGLCALLGRPLRNYFGERRGIGLGMAFVMIACIGRLELTGKTGLIATALIAGIGIALVQALLPAFIKRQFASKAGRVMGLYTTGIMAGAAIAAATAAGLARELDWPLTLAVWALPALVGLVFWFASTTDLTGAELATHPACASQRPAFWRNSRAWELLVFFGIGTGAYTLVLAWLPPYYTGFGWSADDAGFLLGGLTLTEVIAGLAVSAVIGYFHDRRGPLLIVLGFLLAGLLCLLAAPLSLAIPASLLLGLGIGALFPLSLIVTLDHIEDPALAGDLAAFVQGGGYIIAGLMPLLAGILRDRFSDLSQAWIVMAAGTLVLAVMCLRLSPASYGRLSR